MTEEDDADSDPGQSISEQEDRPEDQEAEPEPEYHTGAAWESGTSIHRKPHKSCQKVQQEVVKVLEDLLKASYKERKEAAQKVYSIDTLLEDVKCVPLWISVIDFPWK